MLAGHSASVHPLALPLARLRLGRNMIVPDNRMLAGNFLRIMMVPALFTPPIILLGDLRPKRKTLRLKCLLLFPERREYLAVLAHAHAPGLANVKGCMIRPDKEGQRIGRKIFVVIVHEMNPSLLIRDSLE